MEKLKNMIKKVYYYMMVNISMVKDGMEREKNTTKKVY